MESDMTGGGAGIFEDPVLLGAVLALAAIVTLPIAIAAGVAYHRRRETSYLLVALALLALVARIAVAAGTLLGVVPDNLHHVAEHGLDVTIAALLIAAILFARGIDATPDGEHE